MADNGTDPQMENEDDDVITPGYKAPEKKSLKEIQTLDKDDESLERYKKQLLGDLPAEDDGDPRNVIVKKMSFCPKGREAIELDLTGDISKLKEKTFTVKEGCDYQIEITFLVKREIVSGLRLVQSMYRSKIRVDHYRLMVGSYGPKSEDQKYTTPFDKAPSGLVSRGSYKVKSNFTDDDKNDYLSWEWGFELKKEWD